MKEIEYRNYQLWAYTVSHSILVIRSPLMFSDQQGYDSVMDYNIDIEFSAVVYLDIPMILKGIQIIEVESDIPSNFLRYTKLGHKVYSIVSEERVHYIVAGNYRVCKNKWVDEDIISNMELKHDEVLFESF